MTFNTGNNVPSTDPRDLYDNAENLDKLVNGADPFYADRKGVLRESWAGMKNTFDTSQTGRETAFTLSQADKEARFQAFLVSSGYVSKGDYAANVVLAERNEYVAVSATTTGTSPGLYRPNASATLPLTLTGTWANDSANLVLLGDDVLRQELAGSGGAALVGTSDGSTIQENLHSLNLRLSDEANVKAFGAIADGTLHPLSERYATLADAQAVYPHATALTQSIDWAAAQAALNSGAPRVHFPGARYIISDDLSRTTSVMLVGDGTTALEFAAGKRLTIEGSLTALPALGANITPTSRSVTFASAPALSAGDVFIAYNPTDYSWSPHRAYYRAGEFFRVHSVSGSVASIYGLPADTYAVADMQMHKVNGVQVSLEDITVKADASTIGAPVVVRFGVGVSLKNFRGSGGSSYQIELDRCYQVDIVGGAALNNSASVDDEYGICISNCHRVTITGGGHSATRHAIALGGNDVVGCVPCRDVIISGMILGNNAGDVAAADMHGNVDRVSYSDCTILSHANMSGRDVSYRGCTVYARASVDGLVIYGSEVVGGTFLIDGCTLVTAGDLNAYGAISLMPSLALMRNWNVAIRGLVVKGGAGGASAKIVRISVANGESKKTNIDIRGTRCELAQAQCALYLRCETNTSHTVSSDGHIVDDHYGPAGMYLIHPTGAALTGIPTRQMEQVGEVVVSGNGTSTALPASNISFRYLYSKKPTATACASGVDGAAFSVLGSQPPVPVVYALAAVSIRPGLVAAASTFTSGAQAVVGWRAGIREI